MEQLIGRAAWPKPMWYLAYLQNLRHVCHSIEFSRVFLIFDIHAEFRRLKYHALWEPTSTPLMGVVGEPAENYLMIRAVTGFWRWKWWKIKFCDFLANVGWNGLEWHPVTCIQHPSTWWMRQSSPRSSGPPDLKAVIFVDTAEVFCTQLRTSPQQHHWWNVCRSPNMSLHHGLQPWSPKMCEERDPQHPYHAGASNKAAKKLKVRRLVACPSLSLVAVPGALG